ncbi:MAG: hypothetical protein CL920_25125 [Deltaproteobacteria bacterium]|nr:hypothetical protein [Deltaproteobacteria bacterium]MBU51988.1 hypothetical protein [Deltaproteobacteria bacterium]|tara:strand:- start:9725 stop:10114 length:390 start_codon:yes stop_codon:yes gene_type:complete
MKTEILIFLMTFGLAFVHMFLPSIFYSLKKGLGDLAGNRDNLAEIQSLQYERAQRANANFKETLPWALATLILVVVLQKSNSMTAIGAWMYFGGRALYLPIYVIGIPYVRTLIWGVSIAGIVTMALQLM